jgi:hypothetical protein
MLSYAEQDSVSFQSTNRQTQLIELYSSQGCSSCPPAESWVNQFVDHPDLFKSMIPLVFHVDYWDYIGWKDPFGSPAYSDRQRDFKRQRLSRSVYTPEFIVDGNEWRGWFRRQELPIRKANAGILSVDLSKDLLNVSFEGEKPVGKLHIAIVGSGISTYVQRGENTRKTLEEEFVVFNHQTFDAASNNGNVWQVNWEKPSADLIEKASKIAAVVWVTTDNALTPIQATGGWLPESLVL